MPKVLFMAVLLAAAAMAQINTANPDAYQHRYAANLAVGDSFVNLTNAGANGGDFSVNGDICANVYVIDPNQEVIACCACSLTPGHLKTLSVKNDLVSDTLTPGVPTAITVQIIASKGTSCNAATVTTTTLTSGLGAWMATPHATPSGTYTMTETPFASAPLSQDQFTKLTTYCGWIKSDGSGYGICKACRAGAAGADRQ